MEYFQIFLGFISHIYLVKSQAFPQKNVRKGEALKGDRENHLSAWGFLLVQAAALASWLAAGWK